MNKKYTAAAYILLLPALTAICIAAAPDVTPKTSPLELSASSTLDDYLAYAALNNPSLKAAFNKFKAALEEIPQAKSLPDPRFEYKYFIEEVETRVGPQQQSFAISQAFPWFGKLDLRADAAAQAAQVAMQRYQAAKLKLFFDVKVAYYEYYYLSKSIGITAENVALLEHLESIAVSRYKADTASHSDVIRAQLELGKLQDRYSTLQDMKEPFAAKLNAALNRPISAEMPFPKSLSIDDTNIDENALLKAVSIANPSIKAADHEIDQNRLLVELSEKNYYPDFNFGIGFIDTGDSLVGNPEENGKDPIIAMVSINLPLWRDKYDARKRQARRNLLAVQQKRNEKLNSLAAELKMTLYRFRDANRRIKLYRDGLVPKAGESLKVTESNFRSGKSSFTDLIDAQRLLLEFALSYQRALTDKHQNLAKMEMLTGQNIQANTN
jgi:outer membrane protein TolC